jgi:hypothetical protein
MSRYSVAVVLLLAALAADAGESRESKLIASAADGTVEGVVVLSLSGGHFPIPSRYAVMVSYNGDGLRLVSPAFNANELQFPIEGEMSMITISQALACEFLEDTPGKIVIVEQGSAANLVYQSTRLSIDDGPEVSSVQISDGTACISIIGDTTGFWKDSIRAYSNLREKSARWGKSTGLTEDEPPTVE